MKRLLEVITLESSAETFIGDQLLYLKEVGGYDVHLICSPSPNLQTYAAANHAKYKAVTIHRQLSIREDIKALKEIMSYMKEQKFDVIVVHSFPKAFLLSMIASFRCGVKIKIEVSHGAVYETMPFIKRHCFLFGERILSFFATKVICVSPSVIKSRLHYRLNNKEKLCLLSKGTCTGVDTIVQFNPDLVDVEKLIAIKQQHDISENDFVIGFCGRLVRDKGIVELVDGFNLLKKKYPHKSIKLLIVGSPEKRDALPQETLDFLSSDQNVVYTGFVPYKDIAPYYALMNTFILPSYREGFPTVVLEASSMGLPVITTRKTGCIDSIIDGETGLFIDLNAQSIAETLERMMDKEFAHKLGQNGRKWVTENFEHTIVREAMLNLINSLTNV